MAEISAKDDIPIPVRRALRLIESHPSVRRVTADRVEGSDVTLAVVDIRTELPNAWRAVSFGPLIAVCCQAHIFELSNGKVVAPAPSELVGVAETARARLIHALLARHWTVRAG